jgi:cytochrome c1
LRYTEPIAPGTMNKQQYEEAIVDIVNFMAYIAEPAKLERIRLGIKVLIFLSILFVFAYWAKREFWRDVH